MAKKKSIKEGVEIIHRLIEQGANPAKIIKAIRLLSSDPVYNLICFLISDYGDVMTGMTEQDWKIEAETILKITGNK